jgi:hypothetical protein
MIYHKNDSLNQALLEDSQDSIKSVEQHEQIFMIK